jgi:hexokinase
MHDVPQNLQQVIAELENTFGVSKEILIKISDHFVGELQQGLTEEGGDIPVRLLRSRASHALTIDADEPHLVHGLSRRP